MTTQKKTEKNIYQRLHAVMQGLSFIQKEDKKVNNQYTFVSHDAVTAAVRGRFVEQGIVSIPQNLKVKQDGNRTEVTLDMAFVNIDKPDDRILVPSFGYGIDQQDKGPGKAMSYAVKYAYLKALALETGDDPELDQVDHTPAAIPPPKPTPKPGPVNPLQEKAEKIKAQLKECTTPETVHAVWSGFGPALEEIKAASPDKAYAALYSLYGEMLEKTQQAPHGGANA